MCCLPKQAHGIEFHPEVIWAKNCPNGWIPELVTFCWKFQLIEELKGIKSIQEIADKYWNQRDIYLIPEGAKLLKKIFEKRPMLKE